MKSEQGIIAELKAATLDRIEFIENLYPNWSSLLPLFVFPAVFTFLYCLAIPLIRETYHYWRNASELRKERKAIMERRELEEIRLYSETLPVIMSHLKAVVKNLGSTCQKTLSALDKSPRETQDLPGLAEIKSALSSSSQQARETLGALSGFFEPSPSGDSLRNRRFRTSHSISFYFSA